MSVAPISVVLAAASVVAVSAFYSFQIWHQTKLRRADLLLRLYSTWDSLEFQRAFHQLYWADFRDYESLLARLEGRLEVGSYVCAFYDEIGVLLRRRLIDYELVDDLLGNSAIQLWEKVAPVIREARVRSHDDRLYEHFELLYEEMAVRAAAPGRRRLRRQARGRHPADHASAGPKVSRRSFLPSTSIVERFDGCESQPVPP